MQTTFAANLDKEFEPVLELVSPRVIDCHVEPRGLEQMTAAPEECWLVPFEPAMTEHTGERKHALTVSSERQLAHLSAAPQQPRAQET